MVTLIIVILIQKHLIPRHSSCVQDKLAHLLHCKCAYELCTRNVGYCIASLPFRIEVMSFYSLKRWTSRKLKKKNWVLQYCCMIKGRKKKVEDSRVKLSLRREGWGKVGLDFALISHYPTLLRTANKLISLNWVCLANDSNCWMTFLSLSQPKRFPLYFLPLSSQGGEQQSSLVGTLLPEKVNPPHQTQLNEEL